MILDFSVKNFLSIKDEITLSLEAASIRERESENVFPIGSRRLLKGAVIYGANASGKSNLIKALSFMDRFVRESSKDRQEGEPIPVQPFRLSTETENEPSVFEIRILIDAVAYRYGFSVDNLKVVEEWLYSEKKPDGKETELFSRDRQKINVKNEFHEGKGLEEKTRANALFLSVCAQFNGKLAKSFVQEFNLIPILTSTNDPHMWRATALYLNSVRELENQLRELLRSGDLGVSDMSCSRLQGKSKEEIPGLTSEDADDFHTRWSAQYKISLSHPKRDKAANVIGEQQFDLFSEESEGTVKLFGLGGHLLLALRMGSTIVVDEFDARLHPVICSTLVKLFNSKRNTKGAQLVIATHDTNLLTYGQYRRDQIWFTEKDSSGATDLYSLVEYKTEEDKKIRNDASYEKDYIVGRYGAIPYLGDFEKLLNLEASDVSK